MYVYACGALQYLPTPDPRKIELPKGHGEIQRTTAIKLTKKHQSNRVLLGLVTVVLLTFKLKLEFLTLLLTFHITVITFMTVPLAKKMPLNQIKNIFN